MDDYFTYEKIDKVRDVLEDHHRGSVIHHLRGLVETTFLEQAYPTHRTYGHSGDVGFIFLGPAEMLEGTITEDKETGDLTFSVKIPKQHRTYGPIGKP